MIKTFYSLGAMPLLFSLLYCGLFSDDRTARAMIPKVEDLQKITVVPAGSSEFPNKHDIPKDLGEYTWSQELLDWLNND